MVGASLEQAISLLKEKAKAKNKVIKLPLTMAGGRILAKDIIAPFSQPPFDRSPLDGYAFAAADSTGASKETPARLKVIGEVCAGGYFEGEVKSGEAVRIMTGAPIPKGCDCVLRQEDTNYGEEVVELYVPLKPYSNYCYKGEDIKEGITLLQKGQKLSAITLGVLASMGIEEVEVLEKVKVGLICTGDELMPLDRPLLPGKIYNSNGYMIAERIRELGLEVEVIYQCEDTAGKVADKIKMLYDKIDLVVTTGGVSVGKKDIMHEVFKILGVNRLFWRIAMQPGTPVLAGTLDEKLIIGLSGNPFAALANFELLVREVVAVMQQDPELAAKKVKAKLISDFTKGSKKRRFIRASYAFGEVSLPHTQHASGSLYSMSLCNCLIDIPPGTEGLKAGDEVQIVLL